MTSGRSSSTEHDNELSDEQLAGMLEYHSRYGNPSVAAAFAELVRVRRERDEAVASAQWHAKDAVQWRQKWEDEAVAFQSEAIEVEKVEAERDAAVQRADEAASTAEGMCHWLRNASHVQGELSHKQFHFGYVCPYRAVAAVLRGEPDPRPALAGSGGRDE